MADFLAAILRDPSLQRTLYDLSDENKLRAALSETEGAERMLTNIIREACIKHRLKAPNAMYAKVVIHIRAELQGIPQSPTDESAVSHIYLWTIRKVVHHVRSQFSNAPLLPSPDDLGLQVDFLTLLRTDHLVRRHVCSLAHIPTLPKEKKIGALQFYIAQHRLTSSLSVCIEIFNRLSVRFMDGDTPPDDPFDPVENVMQNIIDGIAHKFTKPPVLPPSSALLPPPSLSCTPPPFGTGAAPKKRGKPALPKPKKARQSPPRPPVHPGSRHPLITTAAFGRMFYQSVLRSRGLHECYQTLRAQGSPLTQTDLAPVYRALCSVLNPGPTPQPPPFELKHLTLARQIAEMNH
ncbi:MAG: hypothetical protein SP1CHLAM54_13340 [Chlamydiia bacterium]|nr:hypothetical protein [Chlamydiia bacterium]MCH9616230.1 hypothetical protein [Chlamydiia bacterium]MCH9629784.1 hypothetical protein [Chlamydiia bacterium]